MLENHPIFGGEAKPNEFIVDGHRLIAPQGSDHFATPKPGSIIAKFYASVGVDANKFEYQKWQSSSPEIPLGRSSNTFRRLMGSISAPISGTRTGCGHRSVGQKAGRGSDTVKGAGRDPQIPGVRRLAGENQRALDAITMEEYMIQKFGLSQDTIRKFLVPGPGDGFGIGPDVLSAYAFGFGGDPMNYGEETALQSFPGGMRFRAPHGEDPASSGDTRPTHTGGGLSRPREFRRPRPPRQRCTHPSRLDGSGREHQGPAQQSEFVHITYTRKGKVYRLKARAVVMAGGSWTTKHVVTDLPRSNVLLMPSSSVPLAC